MSTKGERSTIYTCLLLPWRETNTKWCKLSHLCLLLLLTVQAWRHVNWPKEQSKSLWEILFPEFFLLSGIFFSNKNSEAKPTHSDFTSFRELENEKTQLPLLDLPRSPELWCSIYCPCRGGRKFSIWLPAG